MGNWLEEGFKKLNQEEEESNNRWKDSISRMASQRREEEAEKTRNENEYIETTRRILKTELEKIQPEKLLTDIKNTFWRVGNVIYAENLSGDNTYTNKHFVAYGLVYEYQTRFDYGETVDPGTMGNGPFRWQSDRVVTQPAYVSLAIGATDILNESVKFYVKKFSTQHFQVDNLEKNDKPVFLHSADFAKSVFGPNDSGYVTSVDEIMEKLVLDCKTRVKEKEFPLDVEAKNSSNFLPEKPKGILGLFRKHPNY